MERDILKMLPHRVAERLNRIAPGELMRLTEIRLRAGRPVALTLGSKVRFLEQRGIGILPSSRNIILGADELERCFVALCENSVYAHEKELAEGFISLPYGCRAGVSGTYINRPDGSIGIRDISSINIRIANEVKGAARELVAANLDGGVLICGAPHSGKTTLLRDYVRRLSDLGERIVLVDCRGELASVKDGVPTLDVGVNTDVISGGEKHRGIENALRALAPDIIAFDEIGSAREVEAISDCLNSGVRVITTIHASSMLELRLRDKKMDLLGCGAFSNIIMLNKFFRFRIYKSEDLLYEISSSNSNNCVIFDYGDDDGGKTQFSCKGAEHPEEVYA